MKRKKLGIAWLKFITSELQQAIAFGANMVSMPALLTKDVSSLVFPIGKVYPLQASLATATPSKLSSTNFE